MLGDYQQNVASELAVPRLCLGAVIGVTMILFNVTRICLMSWNDDFYHYWHDGIGAQIFTVGASLTILMLSLNAARSARRPI